MGRYLKTADIIRFVDELPGGNPPQYARLLAVPVNRINSLLQEGGAGRRLVLTGKINASPFGGPPKWAIETTKRGELDGTNIQQLPQFVLDLIENMHPNYRDDGMFLFKTLIEMSSGRTHFEQGVTNMVDTYSELGHHTAGIEGQLDDRRKQLLLLEQESAFWRRNMREIADEHGIQLPPLMQSELQIADLRAARAKVPSDPAPASANDDASTGEAAEA